MENIDLYDIHDTAFDNRPECNDCTWQRGEGVNGVQCVHLEAMNHEGCPFVEAVQSDIDDMMRVINNGIMFEFIEEVMELNINNDDREAMDVYHFILFMGGNPSLFGDKLTDFFTKRLRDENNYRGVNVKVS